MPTHHHNLHHTPVQNSAMYHHHTPSGLTFATPGPKGHHVGISNASTPTGTQGGGGNMYEEVPAHEPDLSKKPQRSALKGAKQRQELQHALTLQLRMKHQEMNRTRYLKSGSATLPKATPPKIAPKPNFRLMSSS